MTATSSSLFVSGDEEAEALSSDERETGRGGEREIVMGGRERGGEIHREAHTNTHTHPSESELSQLIQTHTHTHA